jgi:hypothetical protein
MKTHIKVDTSKEEENKWIGPRKPCTFIFSE